MKYNIVEITVPLTKSTSQVTRWAVIAGAPYASINHEYWQELQSVRDANMPISPRAFLLRSDYTEEKHTGNREDAAGFSYGRSKDAPNPGTIILRGVDMGEIWLNARPANSPLQFRGLMPDSYGRMTPGQREWLQSNVTSVLEKWIIDNMPILRAQALDTLRENIETKLRERDARTIALRNEAEVILAAINI